MGFDAQMIGMAHLHGDARQRRQAGERVPVELHPGTRRRRANRERGLRGARTEQRAEGEGEEGHDDDQAQNPAPAPAQVRDHRARGGEVGHRGQRLGRERGRRGEGIQPGERRRSEGIRHWDRAGRRGTRWRWRGVVNGGASPGQRCGRAWPGHGCRRRHHPGWRSRQAGYGWGRGWAGYGWGRGWARHGWRSHAATGALVGQRLAHAPREIAGGVHHRGLRRQARTAGVALVVLRSCGRAPDAQGTPQLRATGLHDRPVLLLVGLVDGGQGLHDGHGTGLPSGLVGRGRELGAPPIGRDVPTGHVVAFVRLELEDHALGRVGQEVVRVHGWQRVLLRGATAVGRHVGGQHLLRRRQPDGRRRLGQLVREGLRHQRRHAAGREGGVEAVDELGQRLTEVKGRLVAILGARRQRLHGDGVELLGDAVAHAGRWVDLRLAHLGQQVWQVVLLIEHLAREQLVEHDAGGEDVAAVVHGIGPGLLRRHVVVLALDHPDLGLARALSGLGDAEVDDLHLAGEADHHVLGRDVAMHDAEGAPLRVTPTMRVVEAVADLGRDVGAHVEGQLLRELARPGQQPRGVGAFDELHHDEVGVLVLPEVEDLGDVDVVQQDRELGLVHQHVEEVRILGVARVDDLDGHELLEATETARLAYIDLRHPAYGQAAQQAVLTERPGEIHGSPARLGVLEDQTRLSPSPPSIVGGSHGLQVPRAAVAGDAPRHPRH